jgi:hypothetical protein
MADTPTEQTPGEGADQTGLSTWREVLAEWLKPPVVVGLVVLIAFLLAFRFMLGEVGNAAELHWTRLVYLYGTVEAIVFAAAGAIFGTTVTRQRAEGWSGSSGARSGDSTRPKDNLRTAFKKRVTVGPSPKRQKAMPPSPIRKGRSEPEIRQPISTCG